MSNGSIQTSPRSLLFLGIEFLVTLTCLVLQERNSKSSFFNLCYFSILNPPALCNPHEELNFHRILLVVIGKEQKHLSSIGVISHSMLARWSQGLLLFECKNMTAGCGFYIMQVFFLLGSPVYRFQRIGGSPLTRVLQVIFADICN
jgi:hypothetical protein